MNEVQTLKWISVKDALPFIPTDRYAVHVLVCTYDSCLEELSSSNGTSVYATSYSKIDPNTMPDYVNSDITEDFTETYYGSGYEYAGPTGDPVMYWMYLPEAPSYKTKYNPEKDKLEFVYTKEI